MSDENNVTVINVLEIQWPDSSSVVTQVRNETERTVIIADLSASTSSTTQISEVDPEPGTQPLELTLRFMCGVCSKSVTPPMMKCPVGHEVCTDCKPYLTLPCPLCKRTRRGKKGGRVNGVMPSTSSTGSQQHSEMTNPNKCCICFKSDIRPLTQCPSGHVVCANCRHNITIPCPKCKKIQKLKELITEVEGQKKRRKISDDPSASTSSIAQLAPVDAHFVCSACKKIVPMPIMQCKVGHLVCTRCKLPSAPSCPRCKQIRPMARVAPFPQSISNNGDPSASTSSTAQRPEISTERQDLGVNMAQVGGQKRRGISSGDPSASTSSTTQLSAIGTAPGTLTDELAALFECPVCFEIVLPPIMQCQVGHLVCASCRPKLSCCPTCRGTLGNIRNLAMEKVANNLMFPCKHKSTGCRISLGLNEKAEHEEICEFRPYSCPCPGASCSWQGQLDKVMVHLQHAHKNITTLNGEDIVFLATEINLAGAVDWVMMQSCFGHHFMLVLEKQEKSDGHTQFFAIVQLIGSRKQAEHFAYRLELNGNRRRLIWEAMPRSSHEGVASAIMGSDCLVFDNSIAQHFADNGNLGINVTISLVC